MPASKGKIYIGTSGWMYKDWHDSFYPEDLPKTDLLKFYASQFSSVEVNVTFSRLVTHYHCRMASESAHNAKLLREMVKSFAVLP